MSALDAPSAAAAAEEMRCLAEAAYNPFQLLIADSESAWLVVYRDTARVVELEPGPHIVGNVEDASIAERVGTTTALEADALQSPSEAYAGFEGVAGLVDRKGPRTLKLDRIARRVERLVDDPGFDVFEGLARICREHEDEEGISTPFEATCVHIRPPGKDVDRYGTRSSLLLELSEDPGSSRLWATDGAPCRHPYENRSSLLKDLGLG